MGDVAVGAVHEAVVEEEGGTVAEEGVALHLPQADAALILAALDGLPRELVHGARGSNLMVRGVMGVVVRCDTDVGVGCCGGGGGGVVEWISEC